MGSSSILGPGVETPTQQKPKRTKLDVGRAVYEGRELCRKARVSLDEVAVVGRSVQLSRGKNLIAQG